VKFGGNGEEFEIFQVLKQSDEEDDLLTGTSGTPQGERSDRRQEVIEILSDLRHETGDVQVVYPELLEVV
jgi:hypothetical protein